MGERGKQIYRSVQWLTLVAYGILIHQMAPIDIWYEWLVVGFACVCGLEVLSTIVAAIRDR